MRTAMLCFGTKLDYNDQKDIGMAGLLCGKNEPVNQTVKLTALRDKRTQCEPMRSLALCCKIQLET